MSIAARRLSRAKKGTVSALSGWPDATNTGYRNAPGYTGSLTDGSAITITSGQTYTGVNFVSAGVGTQAQSVSNVTFVGCRFAAVGPDAAAAPIWGTNITFSYCSFEPATASVPVAYSGGYQYGISADGAYNTFADTLTVSYCDFWGFGNALTVSSSSQTHPVIVQDCWFHDPRSDGGLDHTDGVGHITGPGTMSYVTLHHNSIVASGNTNGIAFQYGPYDHFTVTHNLLGGFGYTVNIGGGAAGNTTVIFTDNVFTDEIMSVYGPLYDWADGGDNLWRRNTFHLPVPTPPLNTPGVWENNGAWGPMVTQADEGKFWYPDGTAHMTDYTG